MRSLVKNFSLLALLATSSNAVAQDELFDPFALGSEEMEPEVIYYNYAKLRVGYVSDDNFQFGKYDDFFEDGAWVMGDLFYSSRGDSSAWSLDVTELGQESQALTLTYDTKGNLGIVLDYSESPIRRNDTGLTPFMGGPFGGGENLVLPSTWVAGVNTGDFSMAQITHEISNDVIRKNLGLEISRLFGMGLRLTGNASLEEKSGTMLQGMAIYSNAANPQAVVLPVPVDQETSEFELAAGFSNRSLSLEVRGGFTRFKNDHDLITWENPYASGLGAADYPTGVGGFAPAPDYEMVSWGGTLGYRVTDAIYFTLEGMTSATEQQDPLQGYTARPGAATTPPSRMFLDDALTTNLLDTSVSARLLDNFSVKVGYRFNERENEMARYAWQYVRGDSETQLGPEYALFNRPLHLQKDTYTVEGKYRLENRTTLAVVYDYEETQRNFASVTETEEDIVTFKLAPPRNGKLNQRFELSVSNLAGSTYEWSRSFFQEYAVDLINQIPDDQRWTNHPLLRQYHLANREKTTATWTATYFPTETWMWQGTLSSHDVTFDKSELGLTDVLTASANLSVHYLGSETYNAWLWIDYANDERTQTGRDFNGGLQKPANEVNPPLPEGSDPARNFDVEQQGQSAAVGMGMEWQISDKWSIETAYTYLWAEERYEITTFGARDLAGTDLPDSRYEMHNLETTLDFDLNDRFVLSIVHEYFRYTDTSWQYDGLAIGDIDKVLTTGRINPNEAINMLSLTLSYSF